MKSIVILILGVGMIASPVAQAQEAGQGSTVPRQAVLVAQAGTPPPAGATAATVSATSIAVGVAILAAAIVAASGGDSATTASHH